MALNEYIKLKSTDYDVIFRTIYNMYIEHCKTWSSVSEYQLNLKTLQVCNICNDEQVLSEDFEKYMRTFRKDLGYLYTNIFINLQKELEINKRVKFTGRVKTEDSILNKVYRKSTECGGHFPINNCLNDLLGFRIIDPYYSDNILEVKSLLNEYINSAGYKIRHMRRDKDGYKAYHIYFRADNKSFPIEIQIWNMEDELENIKLHRVYKQDYVENIINSYNKF